MNSFAFKLVLLIDLLWRRRYTLLLPMLLLTLFGIAIGTFSDRKYIAHTSMLIQETSSMNPFLVDLSVSAQMNERFTGLQSLMHSRHILGKVAKELKLISDDSDPKESDKVLQLLSDNLAMSIAGKDMIRIEYRSNKAEGMAETLRSVSSFVIEELLAPERSSMQDSSYFLSEHIKFRREELDKAENALVTFRNENADALPELQLANQTRLDYLQQKLLEKQSEMAGAQKSLGSLDEQLSRTNPVIGKLEDQIVKRRSELTLLRSRYTDQHRAVQTALNDLKRLEAQREEMMKSTKPVVGSNANALWDMASATTMGSDESVPLLVSQLESLQQSRNRAETLKEETAALQGIIDSLQLKINSSGAVQQEILKLERDLEVKRKSFEELLVRQEKARLTSSLGVFEQDKRIKIIDQPYSPTRASNLPVIVFAIAGFLGGVLLGAGGAILQEFADTTIRRIDQLERITGAPVLTRLPKMPTPLYQLDLCAKAEDKHNSA
ncbi:MAG: GumC family protein [Vibrionaceae bacterium]